MKKAILVLLTLVISFTASGQEESSWWIFGDGAAVEFTPNPQNRSSEPFVVNSGFDQDEGVGAISDELGNLLFFTDGIRVYNRNGNIMPNGDGLLGNPSSTQSAIVVKAPETPNVYFIVTVGTSGVLAYSRVEMDLNSGLGDVVPGIKNIILSRGCAEKVAATIQTGSNNAYVMSFARSNSSSTVAGSGDFNALFAWEIRGIPGPNISFVLPAPVPQANNLSYYPATAATSGSDNGMLRVSPDGTKLALGNHNFGLTAPNNGCFLYDFNPGNGQFGGAGLQLDTGFVYGIEFSASSQYLYHDISPNYGPGGNKRLVQYDLCDPSNILATRNEFANVSEARGTLQLGRDGEIYVANDARELLQAVTGVDWPVEVLRFWVTGHAAPWLPGQARINAAGQLVELRQNGWVVQYDRYQAVDGYELPGRIWAEGEGSKVRLAVRNWMIE